jgi:hypothetical protein
MPVIRPGLEYQLACMALHRLERRMVSRRQCTGACRGGSGCHENVAYVSRHRLLDFERDAGGATGDFRQPVKLKHSRRAGVLIHRVA